MGQDCSAASWEPMKDHAASYRQISYPCKTTLGLKIESSLLAHSLDFPSYIPGMSRFLSEESSSPGQQSCHRDPTKGEKYEVLGRKPTTAVGQETGGIEGQGEGGRQEHIAEVPKTDRKVRVVSKKIQQAQNQTKPNKQHLPPKKKTTTNKQKTHPKNKGRTQRVGESKTTV